MSSVSRTIFKVRDIQNRNSQTRYEVLPLFDFALNMYFIKISLILAMGQPHIKRFYSAAGVNYSVPEEINTSTKPELESGAKIRTFNCSHSLVIVHEH